MDRPQEEKDRRKLRAVRALHVQAYTMETDVPEIAEEFFFAVGDLLEGCRPEDLDLRKIDKGAFLRELEHG